MSTDAQTPITIPEVHDTLWDDIALYTDAETFPPRPEGIGVSLEFDDGVVVNVWHGASDDPAARAFIGEVRFIAGDVYAVPAGSVRHDNPFADEALHEYVSAVAKAADCIVYGLAVKALGGEPLDAVARHLMGRSPVASRES